MDGPFADKLSSFYRDVVGLFVAEGLIQFGFTATAVVHEFLMVHSAVDCHMVSGYVFTTSARGLTLFAPHYYIELPNGQRLDPAREIYDIAHPDYPSTDVTRSLPRKVCMPLYSDEDERQRTALKQLYDNVDFAEFISTAPPSVVDLCRRHRLL